MIRRTQLFLGPARSRAFVLLLGITGLISLMLNAVVKDYAWVTTAQSIMAVIFLVGTAIIFGGRMDRDDRIRWLSILAPALGAIAIGIFFLPHLMLLFLGGAFGWILVGLFVFRARSRMEYQKAIKLLRKERYDEAVKVMDNLIKAEPEEANHYRLRAEILRLWGKLGPARRDYRKMIDIAPDSAVAYNGLAEVSLQAGEYETAREAALKAFELSPDEWVAAYNLGMIEDRLALPDAAAEHLRKALELKVPDSRHRLLIHLYLARAYSRLGDLSAAENEITALKHHKNGLEEWQVILNNSMAAVLRDVLAEDVQTAQNLVDGKIDSAKLGQGHKVSK